ncbi:MAG: hypothetical protein K2Y23_03855 [Cyanobacteria bacterium]|nr:hypothetical protein [Cyanobacteriota bacterium]
MSIMIAAMAVALVLPSGALAAGPPFELSVKRDHGHVWGASRGTLVVGQDGIEYRTTDKDDVRTWSYDDIKQIQILSPTRLRVLTYEDQGRLRLGADRTFRFDVVGGTVASELVTFLLDRTSRSVVTAVMPRIEGEPLFRASVKHQRQGRGSEGVLVLYDSQLLYRTERAGESRHWRFADVFSVLRLDGYRLEIRAYEGGSDDTRSFVFELKSDLPDGFYDALWARVNRTAFDAASKEPSANFGTP